MLEKTLFFEKARIIEVDNFHGTNEITLRKVFAKHGPIASIILVTELHKAFITFYNFGSADTAVKETNKWKINKEMIQVSRPELFLALKQELGSLVKAVSNGADEQEANTPAQQANGKKNNKKKNRKSGPAEAPADAAENSPQNAEKKSDKKKKKKNKPKLTDEERTRAVFVSGPFALHKKAALKEFFQEIGTVEKVVIGFKARHAFVVFADEKEANAACNLDDMEYKDHPRKVRVNMANSKKEKKDKKEGDDKEDENQEEDSTPAADESQE